LKALVQSKAEAKAAKNNKKAPGHPIVEVKTRPYLKRMVELNKATLDGRTDQTGDVNSASSSSSVTPKAAPGPRKSKRSKAKKNEKVAVAKKKVCDYTFYHLF